MKTLVAGSLIALSMLSTCSAGAADEAAGEAAPYKTEVLQLWPGGAPLGNGQTENSAAKITVYHPAKPDGAAVVICPGGGYAFLCVDQEGHLVAQWLSAHGITGVVLEYRLPAGRYQVPLLDAQHAIRMTRANAKAWKVDPKRIGIMGFSAGGHLASTAGTHFDKGDRKAKDIIARQSCRPDFMILIYPVITMGPKTHEGSRDNLLGPHPSPELVDLYSNEKQVTSHTPPAFLAHAKDDSTVSLDNSRDFYLALQAHKVPSEFLELPYGGHGLNGYKGPMWEAWQTRSLAFLAAHKLSK